MSGVPTIRVRQHDQPLRRDARFVLYWMTAGRRLRWNFAVDRAVEWSQELDRPLLIVEVLPAGCRWDTDRHHAFVLQGMAEKAEYAEGNAFTYYPLVERREGDAGEVFARLAEEACVIVADEPPLPAAAHLGGPLGRAATDDDARRGSDPAERESLPVETLSVRTEWVDSHGLLPLAVADRPFPRAFSFRRFLQKTLPDHLLDVPKANPLARVKLPEPARLPAELRDGFPPASAALLRAERSALAELPIDHGVAPVATRGGERAARDRAKQFIDEQLAEYGERRNHPDDDATSNLSPYLHHGHLSVHEVFALLAERESWSPNRLAEKADGKREGWWGLSPAAEAFLDELITWRELSFNGAALEDNFTQYASLPDWARQTLSEHADDPREFSYSLDEFDAAATHDPLWNAAQRQLVAEGRLHNYLRMLWGKKILHWTASPQEAHEVMVELNNRYGLDGRDPNSYSGIGWVLGRYDRAWGPVRPIFGKIRYMTSDSTRRKLRVGEYLRRWAD